MLSRKYVGPVEYLRGQVAMVIGAGHADKVRAQFNDMELEHPDTCVLLGFGWHLFTRSDFEEIVEEERPAG